MKKGETITDYISKVIVILNSVGNNGEILKETQIEEKILRTLTEKFNYIFVSIKESKDITTLTVVELQSSLIVHEQKFRKKVKEEEQVLKVTQEGFGKFQKRSISESYRGRGRGASIEEVWSFESGCSNHMSGYKVWFIKLDKNFKHTVKLVNDSRNNVTERGNVRMKVNSITQFKNFKNLIKKEAGMSIQCLRTDGGEEFTSNDFTTFCDEHGINRPLTTIYTPKQNGVAEHKNKIIMNMVRSMLNENMFQKNIGWKQQTGRCMTSERHRRAPVWFSDYVLGDNLLDEEEEAMSIKKNKKWELTSLPKGCKAIGTKWIFTTKMNEKGKIEKHKARLVAKGYSQQFLQGNLEEIVYVQQRVSFKVKGAKDKVYKLTKALYGLKHAPRAWGKNSALVAYSDSDFAEDLDDRRSTSGSVFLLVGGAISRSSKKQPVVTLSTTEIADVMTKPLKKEQFVKLQKSMGLVEMASGGEALEDVIEDEPHFVTCGQELFRRESTCGAIGVVRDDSRGVEGGVV
ncbi:reverse transcriptase [Tanacetum coccineum]